MTTLKLLKEVYTDYTNFILLGKGAQGLVYRGESKSSPKNTRAFKIILTQNKQDAEKEVSKNFNNVQKLQAECFVKTYEYKIVK
mmetsp:Transcript_39438/g.35189  ORF Transcript_39438/g.35189 Transcript_39438/m.35189 type:complete len:84 (-) Transcript_39438:1733-1984(-)